MADWAEIVRQHGPLVWRIAYRLLNHDADAADCFQLTFVAAWKLDAVEPVRNWAGALSRIATSRALEMLRSRYRRRVYASQRADPTAGLSYDPVEQASASELADRLQLTLASIEPKQAEVFCLTCLDGHSNSEVGEMLGITTAHVAVLLNRARTALRQRLQGCEASDARGGRR